ncbi:formin-like protein 4 [Syzygium oleosum]|uniref:formin-like protein 4 n=1 Tax=Syzygium oleosum TaxID=219896 RepID=UPI0024B8FE5E|nr:formin-like protein 4 [Syzygium oleosum]
MASSRGISALLALCVLFPTDVARPEARELRPSDHGLQFQDPPPAGAKPSPEMASFFGAPPSPPNSSASSSPAAPLPDATGSSDDLGWRGASYGGDGGEAGRRRRRRDRVRGALLVASIVCGIAGVALLFASGLVFLFKFRKERRSTAAAAAAAPPPPPLRPPLPLLLPPPPPASGRSGDCKK